MFPAGVGMNRVLTKIAAEQEDQFNTSYDAIRQIRETRHDG
jgi:hypothetical protein